MSEKIGRDLNPTEQAAVQGIWERNWTLNPNMEKIARSLKKCGYKISFSSNCDSGNADRYEEKGWFSVADSLFLSCRMRTLKPEKEYFQMMMASLKSNPDECILIDDHRENVQAARTLGLDSILIDRTRSAVLKANQIIEELAQHDVSVPQD